MLAFDPHHLSPMRALLAALALCAAWASFAPSTARAELALAGDLELDVPVSLDVSSGPGFALRVGYQLHLPALTLTPEIGFHHASFDPDPTLNRGVLGARLGFGEVFRLGVFGHIGIAHESIEIGSREASLTEFSFDLGAFLDFTLLPLLDLGVHLGYGQVSPEDDEDPLRWIPLGAHVALIL